MSYVKKLNAKSFFMFLLMSLAVLSAPSFAQTSSSNQSSIEVNRAAAQQLLADGQANAALRRIEQVIIAAPRDLSARFFRAQILVGLGRGDEVREELLLMSSLKLSTDDQAKAAALLAQIDGGADPFSGKLTLKLAMGYADNVNAWPKNGTTTAGGVELPLPDPLHQKFDPVSDRVTEGVVSFSGKQMLNERRDLAAKFGVSGKLKEAADTVNADQKFLAGNIGIEKQFSAGIMIEAGIAKSDLNRVNRRNDTDVNSDVSMIKYSAGTAVKLPHQMRLAYQFEYAKHDHRNSSGADLSDAKTKTSRLSLGGPVHETVYLRGSLSHARTSSDQKTAIRSVAENGKTRVNKHANSASLLALVVLPHQQRIIGSATYRHSKYTRQYVNVGKRRRDKTQIYALGYSIDGGQFMPELEKIRFGFDISHARTNSNQASAEIHSKTYMLLASRSFDL